jgi:hypothetical protein
MSAYPWYELVEATAGLEQGDFLFDYPIPLVPLEVVGTRSGSRDAREVRFDVYTYHLIIMTQSCDLQKISEDTDVLLCRRVAYPDAVAKNAKLRGPNGWSSLRKGHSVGLHLLNKCEIEGHSLTYQIIDLQKVFTSPIRVVRAHANSQGKRVRLCPPYREHLAQAFARQFMRVGLPADLPDTLPRM